MVGQIIKIVDRFWKFWNFVVASLGVIGSQSQSIKVEISLHPLGQFGWNFGKLFIVLDLKKNVLRSIPSLGYVPQGRTKLVFFFTPMRPNGLKGVKEVERLLSDTLWPGGCANWTFQVTFVLFGSLFGRSASPQKREWHFIHGLLNPPPPIPTKCVPSCQRQ